MDSKGATISKSDFAGITTSGTNTPRSYEILIPLSDGLGTGNNKYYIWKLRSKNSTGNVLYESGNTFYGDFGDSVGIQVVVYVEQLSGKPNILVTGNIVPSISGSTADDTLGYNLGVSNNWKWRDVFSAKGHFNKIFYGENYGTNMGSDLRIKNSVSSLPTEYEFFFDKMEPTRYKYNEGTSNRYHTGFIAQQLVTALEESNLTTQDFAGVMLYHPGEEDECWYLRRDEFVALNTWQIQKLKPRVSALEQTILDYESRISALETEIQNLKS